MVSSTGMISDDLSVYLISYLLYPLFIVICIKYFILKYVTYINLIFFVKYNILPNLFFHFYCIQGVEQN